MLRHLSKEEVELLAEDPVRPHISFNKRTENGRSVIVLDKDGKVSAVVCTAICNDIPISEDEMFDMADDNGNVYVAYTVWSYGKGSGREIINQLRDNISCMPGLNRMVTLSPLTEMAEKFHLRNGAKFLRKGETCQNFEYEV